MAMILTSWTPLLPHPHMTSLSHTFSSHTPTLTPTIPVNTTTAKTCPMNLINEFLPTEHSLGALLAVVITTCLPIQAIQ